MKVGIHISSVQQVYNNNKKKNSVIKYCAYSDGADTNRRHPTHQESNFPDQP